MKNWKKYVSLLLALVLCLSLAACGYLDDIYSIVNPDIGGTDWRTTGVWRDGGTITINGEDTVVLVCIHKADANFYYDMQEQVLFDSVDYPITLEGDAWEAFHGIDFDDLNGDGNSDVTMYFKDGGTDMVFVWFWDVESAEFVYQPDNSKEE